MNNQIVLPPLGENIESCDVLSILVGEGAFVSKEQELFEVETDKAMVPIPSPISGRIVKILVALGQTIRVGSPLCDIEESEVQSVSGAASPGSTLQPISTDVEGLRDASLNPQDENKTSIAQSSRNAAELSSRRNDAIGTQPSPQDAPQHNSQGESGPVTGASHTSVGDAARSGSESPSGAYQSGITAGPAVRRLARKLGVDLRTVQLGSSGRISEDDVRRAKMSVGITQAKEQPTCSDGYGPVRREKMSRIRQTIAKNMVVSCTTIPQLTNFDDVDVSELERIRNDSQKDYESQAIKLTMMPFLVKATAATLKNHPDMNASISEDGVEIIYKEYVNIGIAVDTDRGLVVPVIRDADRKSFPVIARELDGLAKGARSGSFRLEDIRGATFTLSNLGAVGGTYATPIINPPESAILLAGRCRIQPQFVNGAFQPRLMMPLSLTYDHRIVDGAVAARFLNDLKSCLADPDRLLLLAS